MVTGKVKAVIGFQKTPPRSIPESPRHCPSPIAEKTPPRHKTFFARSFGVYFPRSNQVQPRPLADVAELLRLIDELQDNESRLKAEIDLQHKLMEETAAVVPCLESDISSKNAEIERLSLWIQRLEAENEVLRGEGKSLKESSDRERTKRLSKIKEAANVVRTLKEMFGSVRKEAESNMKEIEDGISRLQRRLEMKEVKSNDYRPDKSREVEGTCSYPRLKGLKIETMSEEDSNMNKDDAETTDLNPGDADKEAIRPTRTGGDIAESFSAKMTNQRPARIPRPPPIPTSPVRAVLYSARGGTREIGKSRASFKMAMEMLPSSKPLALMGEVQIPPPPPPPPAKLSSVGMAKVRRVPEVVELYHSLMRRDSKRESGASVNDIPAVASTRSMIGEIENRSAHLLAIKTDVETQGDFIRFLIKEVENAAFMDIEHVVAFVKWLDDELSFLVDERAVLKHFDWPEHKADAMREAAFGYCDLKKLECEVSSFCDDAQQPCGLALKKMQALFEKLEHNAYKLSRMREGAMQRYKSFQIPSEWMLETGFVSKIKFASVKLAMKYMKRISAELEVAGGTEEEDLIIKGVRFAFRVHQFAGGFDSETMRVFQELRKKARSSHAHCQNQRRQRPQCRSTSYLP